MNIAPSSIKKKTSIQIAQTLPQEYFVFDQHKYPAIVGGLGSGKTKAGINRALHLMQADGKFGAGVGYYMPTYDLIKRRAMPGFEEELNYRRIKYEINKGDYYIEVRGLGPIYFRSYDNPGRIVAYEVSHSIVDELDTNDIETARLVWRKISERKRGPTKHKAGNTIGNVTSPDQGFSGFTYERWGHLSDPKRMYVKDKHGKYSLIRAPTYSNPCIPGGTAAYVESIRENYDPMLAEMFIEGLFVSLTHNKVYHFFDRKKNDTSRELMDTDKVIHVCIDFNVGGCCSSVWVIDQGRPMAVTEFVSQHTQDFISKLSAFRNTDRTRDRSIVVYPDATGDHSSTNASKSDIAMIREAGFAVDAPSINPPIRDSVNACNSLYSHQKAFVNMSRCPRLANALETQGYDKKGNPEKYETHPSIDDWTDGHRYFLHRKFPITRPFAGVQLSGV